MHLREFGEEKLRVMAPNVKRMKITVFQYYFLLIGKPYEFFVPYEALDVKCVVC